MRFDLPCHNEFWDTIYPVFIVNTFFSEHVQNYATTTQSGLTNLLLKPEYCGITFMANALPGSSWRRNQMETFSALLALCEGNPPVTGGLPSQRPVMRSFDVFFDLRLNKRLNKKSRRRWFEKPWRSLWHHCNVMISTSFAIYVLSVSNMWDDRICNIFFHVS